MNKQDQPIQTADPPAHEVLIGHQAVWVNGGRGECLGRFGIWGIDVHRRVDEQHLGQCLDCTHSQTTPDDWGRFQKSMLMHHGVDLFHIRMPSFVKEPAT